MEDDGSRDGASSFSFMRNQLGGAFVPYTTPLSSSDGPSFRSAHMRLVARLTKEIVETFQNCNRNFMYSKDQNPKRYLTNPSTGMLNDGFDNVNSDLILHVNLELVNMQSNQRYIVKEILGQGTFGQVAKCWILETNSYVAVKIIKNQPAYYHQALVEVHILKTLNEKFDPDDKHHIVRIYDWFVHREHLCIAFEMLDMNLYELMRKNQFKGFSLSVVQVFSKQILHALVIMKDAGIIHCDLKPENILVSTSLRLGEIKVIDFGSACRESETVYSYIQSRYYRSPEVVLGYQYTTAIDMWSLGCIVAELFLGLPLFPGASEFDLLKRMIEILGAQPPDDLLRYSKNTSKFFKHIGSIYQLEDDEVLKGITSAYRVLTEDEYEAKESRRPPIGKNYFSSLELESIIKRYPYRKNLAEKEITKEKETRLALIDLLRGLLEFDPVKRWSPFQASRHPFVTGEPFICPYKPPPETPRIPVSRTVIVDHNPGGGHWVAAGISPQVSNVNRCLPHNTPRFQMVPLSHGGSLGSFGSYNDNAGLGSSYGSYGDMGNMYPYYSSVGPSGMNMPTHVGPSILGASPDARRRLQLSHGNGYGVSPTGNMQPMSLGASPSQFTPPSSQMQYGPASPARGSIHGSPLGKATSSQYSRRRNWPSPGQQYESASHHRQSHHSDAMSCSQRDSYSRGHVGSPRSTLPVSSTSNWRQQLVSGNELSSTSTTGNHQNFSLSHAPNLNMVSSHFQEGPYGKTECSLSVPDPADWDPDYREDLLFQVDTSEARSNTSGVPNCAVHGTTSERATLASGVARLSLGNNPTHQKTDALFQAYASADGSPPSAHDIRAGCSPLSHFAQTSTSRFRKQSVRENNMRTSSMRGEQSHQKGQPVYSNYTMGDTRSANMMFGNGMSWGGRSGHPVATTSSHGRKKVAENGI